MIGGIIGSATSLINGFNYKKQENDVKIAEYNAQTAQAQSQQNKTGSASKTALWIVGGLVLIGIAYFLLKPATK